MDISRGSGPSLIAPRRADQCIGLNYQDLCISLLAREVAYEGICYSIPSWSPMRETCIEISAERRQHEAVVEQGFYLSKYEFTQQQWQSVMGTTPWLGSDSVQVSSTNPAVGILWSDVQSLVHTLNIAEGDSLYRILTEAEWEYACRAGTTTDWSFGNDRSQLDSFAWVHSNTCDVGECYAHQVGTKLPNPWGFYDMHGNVQEWTDVVEGSPLDGERPVHGGAFHNSGLPNRLGSQSGWRIALPAEERSSGVGVRVARIKPSPTSIHPQSWGRVKTSR